MRKIVQFGILCNSYFLKAWQVKCLKEILSLKNTELSVFILSPEKRGNKRNKRPY